MQHFNANGSHQSTYYGGGGYSNSGGYHQNQAYSYNNSQSSLGSFAQKHGLDVKYSVKNVEYSSPSQNPSSGGYYGSVGYESSGTIFDLISNKKN